MKDTVYLVLDIKLKLMNDTSVIGIYKTLEDAMTISIADVVSKGGKDIKSHGLQMQGVEYSEDRISNNRTLGSEYGISYLSYHGSYPCCRMIIPQGLN